MAVLLICPVWPLERVIMSGTSIIAQIFVPLNRTSHCFSAKTHLFCHRIVMNMICCNFSFFSLWARPSSSIFCGWALDKPNDLILNERIWSFGRREEWVIRYLSSYFSTKTMLKVLKTYVKKDRFENICIFTLKNDVSLAVLQIRERIEKLITLFLIQNICCGYSKEPSQWDGSFEHPKHMFKLSGKKITAILR